LARLQTARRAERTRLSPIPLALPDSAGVISEYVSKEILASAGIKFPRGRLTRSAEEAAEASANIGFPVALKAQSSALAHKSDVGGVVLNVSGREAAVRAFEDIAARAQARSIRLDGILVEAMAEPGAELIVGARRDPAWGPVLLVGTGGVLADVFQDVRLMPPDIAPSAARKELLRLKGAALLTGFRGAPPVDLDALAGLIAAVGQVMLSNPRILEIDLNPVVARPDGVKALDALMVLGAA
jgi:acetate---CoA ligase (ADP-forming)